MTEMGTLKSAKRKRYKLVLEDGTVVNVDPREIDQAAKDASAGGADVYFERGPTREPIQIRLRAPQPATPAPQLVAGGGGRVPAAPPAAAGVAPARPLPQIPHTFHHAYNFIDALDSASVDDRGLHHIHANGVSGEIVVELEVVTPLLIPDLGGRQHPDEKDDSKHRIFDMRVDRDGHPLLAATSVKGPLRAAFEALTGSRFGALDRHAESVAFRTTSSQDIEPVAVQELDGQLIVERYKAAWLPMYNADKHNGDPRRLPGGGAAGGGLYDRAHAETGHKVWVTVEHVPELGRGSSPRKQRKFPYDLVTSIDIRNGDERLPEGKEPGIVVVTGPNVGNKHDERVFYGTPHRLTALAPDLKERWCRLIKDYTRANERVMKTRSGNAKLYLGKEPGDTAISPHIHSPKSAAIGEDPIYCWAVVKDGCVVSLQPVQLSRRLYDAAPDDRVPDALRPAGQAGESTPAERLFGWVGDSETRPTAQRGRVRFGQPRCTKGAIERFDQSNGRPLPILASPKLTQGRFYLGKEKGGTIRPLDRTEQPNIYDTPSHTARGFKVYPHHAARVEATPEKTADAWRNDPLTFVAERSDQNRSITGWVTPGTTFEIRLRLDDAHIDDVRALVWLLGIGDRQRPGHLRMGLGKPLGFGSVRPRIISSSLISGSAWRNALLALDEPASDLAHETLADEFRAADTGRMGQFLVAACGYEDRNPVAYPLRVGDQERKVYEWFKANESTSKRSPGRQLGLPTLGEDDTLGDPVDRQRDGRR